MESALLVLFAVALFPVWVVSAFALFVLVESTFLSLDFSLSNSDSQKTRVSPSNLKSSLSKSRSRLMASFAPLGISTPSFLG